MTCPCACLHQPFAPVGPTLARIDLRCNILILHLTVRRCAVSGAGDARTLGLDVGRNFDQPLADTYRLDFLHHRIEMSQDYLRLALDADRGSLGPSHYRIGLEISALDARHSFLHRSFAYRYGLAAHLAMMGYLAITGRNKLGFSAVSETSRDQMPFVRGTRGAVQRNTRRDYLAVEAYLDTLAAPAESQPDRRLRL